MRVTELKPGQVLSYTNNGDRTFTLTLVQAEAKPGFPPRSLLKYFIAEKN
jgi:hypothetical protein